jgi:chromosomal replication initiation ATPase DnaA
MDLTPLCTKFKISKKDLRSKKRTRDIALKRQLIAYTLRIEHGLSFGEIGNLLNVDHSSAVYCFACNGRGGTYYTDGYKCFSCGISFT